MKISDKNNEPPLFFSKDEDIRANAEINDFLSYLPLQTQELWPFDLCDQGLKTTMVCVSHRNEGGLGSCSLRFDETQILELEGIFHNDKELYTFHCAYFRNDARIKMKFYSFYKEKGSEKRNLAYYFLQKQQKFLQSYDQYKIKMPQDLPSGIYLEAASGEDEHNSKIIGGFIWADKGLEFYNPEELIETRKSFQKFAAIHEISLSDKDLQKFLKPCHFAAFDTGHKISDRQGHKASLGKAFLLTHSWQGKWENRNPEAEEKRFAAIANETRLPAKRRQAEALSQLSRPYRMMLKKHCLHELAQQHRHSLKVYKRWGMRKLAQLSAQTHF